MCKPKACNFAINEFQSEHSVENSYSSRKLMTLDLSCNTIKICLGETQKSNNTKVRTENPVNSAVAVPI